MDSSQFKPGTYWMLHLLSQWWFVRIDSCTKISDGPRFEGNHMYYRDEGDPTGQRIDLLLSSSRDPWQPISQDQFDCLVGVLCV